MFSSRPQTPARRHAEAGLAANAAPCPDRGGEGAAKAAGPEATARGVRGAANAIPGMWTTNYSIIHSYSLTWRSVRQISMVLHPIDQRWQY